VLVNDIIVEFNGHDIEHFTDLPFYVGQYRPGTEAAIQIFREGKTQNLTVILGSSPTNNVAVVAPEVVRERDNPLGFRVSELSTDVRRVTGLSGVQITEISDGPGRESGLIEGDVIVSLNRQEIDSVDKFVSIASNLPEKGFVPIRIVREGQGTTLALELRP
jgi:serine protease Do